MSRRRPPVALLLFTFDISPRRDVAQTSACGIVVIYFPYISPFCGVAQTPDWGMLVIFILFEASLQTLDWFILFLFSDCLFLFNMNDLLACLMNFCFMTDLMIMNYFSAWFSSVILYLVSWCLRVHSKYSLACPWLLSWPDFWRSALTTAPEPRQRRPQPREDRSYPGQLFLWEMESHRRWWFANRFRHQPTRNLLLYS
jgi:hypothetical protein